MDAFDSVHSVAAAWLRGSILAPLIPAYWRRLVDQHYGAGTARTYLCCVAHFARWTSSCRLGVCDLGDEAVRRFVDKHLPRCTCPAPVQRCRHQVRAALRHLMTVLDEAGVLLREQQPSSIDDELCRFGQYISQAKGLAANTRRQQLSVVRLFLQKTVGDTRNEVVAPTPTALRRFVAQEFSRLSPGSCGLFASILRSYLRFRAMGGDRVDHLLPLIASPAHWRLAPLPQTLSQAEVEQLLNAFPVDLPSRLRAYAMVRCVVDLGLRSSEVVDLQLDDIDWGTATLRIVKCKSRRVDLLPLPQATGSAIAAYLRSERPPTANRRIFVRHVAPVDEPIGPEVVRSAVRAAYRRCGLPYTRVHILRNTLATRLLNTGGTLKEVADVLRHRNLDTSMIYAKVDLAQLSAVAMPWPGSAT